MTNSGIDHLFQTIPERRQFIGGCVSGMVVVLKPCPRDGFLVELSDCKITAAGARNLAAALLAAADAAENAGARIK